MYYPYFITYMLIGFVLSLVVFIWAFNSGQFRDQKRARFIPLHGELEKKKVKVSRISRIEVFALLSLVCAGLAASAAVLLFALIRGN